VRAGDKPGSFVGSRTWIGSQELFLVLGEVFKVRLQANAAHGKGPCSVFICPSSSPFQGEFEARGRFLAGIPGGDMPGTARELATHFKTEGTPVMIGATPTACFRQCRCAPFFFSFSPKTLTSPFRY
jgi:hypothetical protein